MRSSSSRVEHTMVYVRYPGCSHPQQAAGEGYRGGPRRCTPSLAPGHDRSDLTKQEAWCRLCQCRPRHCHQFIRTHVTRFLVRGRAASCTAQTRWTSCTSIQTIRSQSLPSERARAAAVMPTTCRQCTSCLLPQRTIRRAIHKVTVVASCSRR